MSDHMVAYEAKVSRIAAHYAEMPSTALLDRFEAVARERATNWADADAKEMHLEAIERACRKRGLQW